MSAERPKVTTKVERADIEKAIPPSERTTNRPEGYSSQPTSPPPRDDGDPSAVQEGVHQSVDGIQAAGVPKELDPAVPEKAPAVAAPRSALDDMQRNIDLTLKLYAELGIDLSFIMEALETISFDPRLFDRARKLSKEEKVYTGIMIIKLCTEFVGWHLMARRENITNDRFGIFVGNRVHQIGYEGVNETLFELIKGLTGRLEIPAAFKGKELFDAVIEKAFENQP